MKSICLYFQVHQPYRLRNYHFFDIGRYHNYYDDAQNKFLIKRIARKCYLPTNELILSLINKFGADFKVSYSLSGSVIEQLKEWEPQVISSFQQLAKTGQVEFLCETYSHSLSSLRSEHEFSRQVKQHQELIKETFDYTPTSFRNTELIYSNYIGKLVADMGFKTILTEGAKHILGWKSPNFLYANAINPKLKVLMRNYIFSDDIAFRFSNKGWKDWPLTAEKFVSWLTSTPKEDEVINIFMDYETFGEHQWAETGIFDFLEKFPEIALKSKALKFNTPSEISKELQPVSAINVVNPISWADEERDLTAWIGNELQNDSFEKLSQLEEKVYRLKDSDIHRDWRRLQGSDHFYYMCTKWFSDGTVHNYFNPYDSPYDAFINYMNVLNDFMIRIDSAESQRESDIIDLSSINVQINKQKSKYRPDTFHDIKNVPKAILKKALSQIPINDIAYAIENSDKEIASRILESLSKKNQQLCLDTQVRELNNTQRDVLRVKILDEILKHYA